MIAGIKRRFLFRAFYPLGPKVCAMTGMPGASFDVDRAEWERSQAEIHKISADVLDRVIERAKWMSEVVVSDEWETIFQEDSMCPECGEPCGEVTLPEILVKFYVAMRLDEQDDDASVR